MKFQSLLFLFLLGCSVKNSSQDKYGFLDQFSSGVSKDKFANYKLPRKDGMISEKSRKIIYPFSIHGFGYCGVFTFYQFEKTDYEKLKKELEQRKIFESVADDSCNLHVYRPLGNMRFGCKKDYFPVPSFLDTLNGLAQNFKLDSITRFFVFDSKSGKFVIESSEVDFSSSADLGDGWKDGYSNGAILNDKTNRIAFWIIFW